MAREIHKFAVTVPPGTPIAAPQLTNLPMPARDIVGVTVIVPPGPRGVVGFALAAAGVPIIPYEPGAWFVTDNEVIEWPLEEQLTSGAWQLLAYNTGIFAHTIEVRFLANLPGQPDVATSPLLPLATLTGGSLAVPAASSLSVPLLPAIGPDNVPLAFVGFDPADLPPAPVSPSAPPLPPGIG